MDIYIYSIYSVISINQCCVFRRELQQVNNQAYFSQHDHTQMTKITAQCKLEIERINVFV